MDIETNQFINPAKFHSFAELNPEAWQWLVNHIVIHKLFGEGIVIQVDRNEHPVFEVRFKESYENQLERKFGDQSMNGKIFTQLWLPIEKVEIIEKKIYDEETKRFSNKNIKVTFGIPTRIIPKPIQKHAVKSTLRDPSIIKCPYCLSSYPPDELQSHIQRMHPQIWKNKGLVKQRKKSASANVHETPIKCSINTLGGKAFYQCPYCHSMVLGKNIRNHIARVHPNESIPETVLRVFPPKMNKRVKKSQRMENGQVYHEWKKYSGRIIQLSMKTIHAGHRHGAIIHRKSY